MSLRDLIITAIVLGVLPFALRHPYAGILLWTWISIMNPHKLAWGFAYNAPFAAMAAGVTLLGLFVTKDKVKLSNDSVVAALVVFLVWTGITTLFALDRAASFELFNRTFKIQLMTLVAIAVLQERKHLEAFVWVNVISLGFYGAKGGLFTLLTGGGSRVWGPPGGFIEGNNELALALVMAIPLMYYLRLVATRRWVRNFLLVAMVLTAVSALGTYSRGALLAIVAMAAFLWWRSPNKMIAVVPMLALAVAMFVFMPENWLERMQSIQNYEQDGSANGRINAWWTMFNLANDRLIGGGFAVYSRQVYDAYAPDPSIVRAAHSIYFQVLGEHGWIGLALFLLIWILGWRMAGRIRRQTKGGEGDMHAFYLLAGMCQVSLVGYAVGGAFLSLAYFDLPYNVLVMLIVAHRLVVQEAAGAPARRGARAFQSRQLAVNTPGRGVGIE
jgi:putative inorganic carbon (HCO3(-)) transporter